MFVTIGRRAQTEDLVDLLSECHQRIRMFSRLAVDLGEREGAPPEDVADDCDRCARYFGEALPLHVEDEERSVLPRLAGQRAEVDEALAVMERQHLEHGPQLAALIEALHGLRSEPEEPRLRAELQAVAGPLARALEEHLRGEEQIVFPAIRALISPEEQRLAVRELRARRQGASRPL